MVHCQNEWFAQCPTFRLFNRRFVVAGEEKGVRMASNDQVQLCQPKTIFY